VGSEASDKTLPKEPRILEFAVYLEAHWWVHVFLVVVACFLLVFAIVAYVELGLVSSGCRGLTGFPGMIILGLAIKLPS